MPPALLALLLHSAVAVPADDAVLVDIREASAADVAALKQADGVRWWVELGDRLMLAGDPPPRFPVSTAVPVLGHFTDVRPGELVLRGVGCDVGESVPGTLVARGGRWQLRRLGAGEAMPAAHGHDESWRVVEPNEVVARQYRLDAPLAAPPDPQILPVVQQVDAARWFAGLSQLASWDRSSYGTTSLFAARDWIGEQFADLGLEVEKPDFAMPGPGGGTITRQNVIGRWTGTTHPDEWIVVGAHYDSRNANLGSTVSAPGAEDNASGCAGVIEMARALVPFRPQRTILFMCYAGEEQNLYGSTRHVQALQASGDIAKVMQVVTMDMIGYSADERLDADYESYASQQGYLDRFGAAAATYVPELHVTYSLNPFGSDHMPYLRAGKETVLAIESDWDIYPYYHKSSDTPANIGPNVLGMGGAILRTNVAVVADLAGARADLDDRVFEDGFDG